MVASPLTARQVRIIAAGCALGAPASRQGTRLGPRALLDGGLVGELLRAGVRVDRSDLLDAAELPPAAGFKARVAAVGAFASRLADTVAAACAAGDFPLVLGGDHVIAAGTWRGVSRALAPHGPLGLVWVDAHLDSHTPDTSHTGNIHGMPLAALLGEGDPALVGLPGPHLEPARVCVIGARSWEPEELMRLVQLGVRVITMEEVRRRGLPSALDEALAIVRRPGGAGFGVSLDLDAVDCAALPATTCPVPDGLDPQALTAALTALRGCPDLAALEIVEYVPALDADGQTARWLTRFASAALGVGAVA